MDVDGLDHCSWSATKTFVVPILPGLRGTELYVLSYNDNL
jgi:hypothetical protein